MFYHWTICSVLILVCIMIMMWASFHVLLSFSYVCRIVYANVVDISPSQDRQFDTILLRFLDQSLHPCFLFFIVSRITTQKWSCPIVQFDFVLLSLYRSVSFSNGWVCPHTLLWDNDGPLNTKEFLSFLTLVYFNYYCCSIFGWYKKPIYNRRS